MATMLDRTPTKLPTREQPTSPFVADDEYTARYKRARERVRAIRGFMSISRSTSRSTRS
jgi:hypothetical protein